MSIATTLLEQLVKANRYGRDAVDNTISEAMLSVGLEVERYDYDPAEIPLVEEFAHDDMRDSNRQTCVIGRLKGKGLGPSLILFAHPDTEPVEHATGWKADPFDPRIVDGRMIGWGVADSLAGIAMMITTLEGLASPMGDVTVISAPSKRHRRGIAAALHAGVKGDAAVYLHAAESGRGLDDIKAFAPGQLECEITILGRAPDTEEPAHTAFAHQAINPFEVAWPIVQALREFDAERAAQLNDPTLNDAIGRSTNIMITACDFGVAARPLQIAETCSLRVVLSLVPGERLQTVQKAVETVVERVSLDDPWLKANQPALTWLSGVAAVSTPQSSDIYSAAKASLLTMGANPRINPLHTSSDIRNPVVQRGIPTVGFGPRCGNLSATGHQDEWVDLADLDRAVDVVSTLIDRWCTGTQP